MQEVIRFAPLILVRWNPEREPSLLTLAILTSSSLPTHKQSTIEHCREQGRRLLSPKLLEQEPRLGRRAVQRTQRMDKQNHHFTRLQAQVLC